MANTIFTPVLSQGANHITAKQPVPDSGAIPALAGIASDVGTSVMRSKKVEGLQKELSTIAKAREAGGDRNKLSLYAKTALNRAKADAPLFSKEFDGVYGDTFGGGTSGSGSVFKATPEEKGVDQAITKAAERAALTGETLAQAGEALGDVEKYQSASAIESAQQVLQKGDKKRALGPVMLSNVANIKMVESDFISTIRAAVKKDGALNPEVIAQIKNAIALQEPELKNLLDDKVMSEAGLLIEQGSYDIEAKRQKDMFARINGLLSNNSAQELYASKVATKSSQEQLVFMEAFPLVNSAKSPEVGERLLELTINPESNWSNSIRAKNPAISKLADNPMQYQKDVVSGFNKMFDPITSKESMSQVEKASTASVIANPEGGEQVLALFDTASDNPLALERLKEVTSEDSDALSPWWSNDSIKHALRTQTQKYQNVLTKQLEGASTKFKAMSISGGANKLPDNVEVKEVTQGFNSGNNNSGSKRIVVSGEGVTREMAQVARNMYLALEANPAMVSAYEEQLGIPKGEGTAGIIVSAKLSGGVNAASFVKETSQDPRTAPITSQDNKFISGPRGKIPEEGPVLISDDSFANQIAYEENRGRDGFDGDVWKPHDSVEGGTQTLAYGHKLTKAEVDSGVVNIGGEDVVIAVGITEEQAQKLLIQDIEQQEDGARKDVSNFDELPEKYQKVLTALRFNTGDVSKKGWPKLHKAMLEGNDEKVREQMLTSYKDKDGNIQTLTSRRDRIADALGIK